MLYEDDFEFEEQPADLRDRTIGGKSGGGRGGGPRGREPRRAGSQVRGREVPEDAKPARDLLRDILERMGIRSVDIPSSRGPKANTSRSAGPTWGC